METLADQRISDGLITARQYDEIRAGIASQITKSRAIEDHRATVILCCKFLNNFPSSGLAPIEKAVKKQFEKIRDAARVDLKSKCPVCGSAMADINCPDDMIRPYCAKCGRTYTPIGYMDDDNYALKWHATTWDGGPEPKEIIEVR
jgi:ribosomal protein S27AE